MNDATPQSGRSSTSSPAPIDPLADALIAPFLQALHARGRLRVWSIVITIFGDLVQPRSQPGAPARLAFSDLGRLTDSLGIAPGALRTAISRLTKEGWLERHKTGRNAWYQLSDSGASSTMSAGQRIYADNTASSVERWRLEVYKNPELAASAALTSPHIPLGDQLVLTPIGASQGHKSVQARGQSRGQSRDQDANPIGGGATLVFEGTITALPDWLQDSLVDPGVTQDYRELATLLTALADDKTRLEALAPHEATVLRCLLLHFWRRLVLKHRPLPASLLPRDWPGLRCRELLPPLYQALWSASEAWVDAAGLAPRPAGQGLPFTQTVKRSDR